MMTNQHCEAENCCVIRCRLFFDIGGTCLSCSVDIGILMVVRSAHECVIREVFARGSPFGAVEELLRNWILAVRDGADCM